MSAFIARGVIGADPGDATKTDRFTYLSEVGADWYQWDGAHRATHFASRADAVAAAASCNGPWFNHPDAGSVEAVRVE